jgi:hypothetical protein
MTTNILNTSSTTVHNNSGPKTFKELIVSDKDPEVTATATEQGRVTTECPAVKELSDVEDQVDNSGEDGCDEHREDRKDECSFSQESTKEKEIAEGEPSIDKDSTPLKVEKEGEEDATIEPESIEGKEIVPFLPFGGFSPFQFPLLPSLFPSQQPKTEVPVDVIDPSILLEGLKPCQMRAIAAVREEAKVMYSAMMSPYCITFPFVLPQRVDFLGFTMDDAKKTAKYLAYEAPVCIHFPPHLLSSLQKEGSYRNRFETGSSNGNPKKIPRLSWEDIVFKEAYKSAPAADRPKYGALNIVNDPRGVKPCVSQYGCAYLQLKKELRPRITFTDMDTSNEDVTVVDCHWKHVAILMQSFTNDELCEVLQVGTGKKSQGDSSVLSWYKEVQIHGLIQLKTDVEKIVLDRSYFKKSKRKKSINFLFTKIKEEYNIPCELVDMT